MLLGHSRTALEWFLARFDRHRDPVCQNHGLERKISRGRIGDDHLSDWRETDQGGNGHGGNPTSAITLSGKVVRGYQVFSVSYPG